MNPTKKGPSETEETRMWGFFEQGKEEPAKFGDGERNHYGQESPRWSLNALSVLEGE